MDASLVSIYLLIYLTIYVYIYLFIYIISIYLSIDLDIVAIHPGTRDDPTNPGIYLSIYLTI
jgi:hypothetical protein